MIKNVSKRKLKQWSVYFNERKEKLLFRITVRKFLFEFIFQIISAMAVKTGQQDDPWNRCVLELERVIKNIWYNSRR